MIIKRKSKKMGVIALLSALIAVGGPVTTHYIDKQHEKSQLKEMHKHDIEESNQDHLHSTHGYRVMIDEMKQEIKILREELAIAKGALGASEDSNLKLVGQIIQLEKQIKMKQKLLDFYVH